MKKGKFLLSAVAILAAVGSSLAFSNAKKNFAGEPVYHLNGTWTECYINLTPNCGQTKSVQGDYYITLNGSTVVLPVGTQLKRP